MTSLIPRPADLREIEALYRVFPAVAILGPRQTGKSTLARLIAESYDEVLFLDLEDPQDLAALDAPKAVLGGERGSSSSMKCSGDRSSFPSSERSSMHRRRCGG
jgi:hypothetical protein